MMKKMLLPILTFGMMFAMTTESTHASELNMPKETKNNVKFKVYKVTYKNYMPIYDEEEITNFDATGLTQDPDMLVTFPKTNHALVYFKKTNGDKNEDVNYIFVADNLNKTNLSQIKIGNTPLKFIGKEEEEETSKVDIKNFIPTKGFLIGTGVGAGLSLAAIIVALECNFGHKIAAKFESMSAEELATLPFFKKALSRLGFTWQWLEETLALRYSNKKIINIAVKVAIVVLVAVAFGLVGRGIQKNGPKKALCSCCYKDTVDPKNTLKDEEKKDAEEKKINELLKNTKELIDEKK